jgi:hypothetical protein
MPGIVDTDAISGSLDSGTLVSDVLHTMINVSSLYSLCRPVPVPNLTGTIPISKGSMTIAQDLEEFERSDVETAEFTYASFSLKKDRAVLAVSDEAKRKSRAGDPLVIQKEDAATNLAAILDKKVITALQTSPQTGATAGAWSTVTNNPMADFATAVAAVKPYKADFVIMPSAVWAKWIANDLYKNIVSYGDTPKLEGAVSRVPGLGLDIFVDTEGYMTAKSVLVGASKACAAYGYGDVEINTERDNNLGAEIYYMDVYRQVLGPIFKNASNLNKAVYQVTAVIA